MFPISGIRLIREGDEIVVYVEYADIHWVEVIREKADGPISHNVSISGLQTALEKYVRLYSLLPGVSQ